jgi:hypothetical protein
MATGFAAGVPRLSFNRFIFSSLRIADFEEAEAETPSVCFLFLKSGNFLPRISLKLAICPA